MRDIFASEVPLQNARRERCKTTTAAVIKRRREGSTIITPLFVI